MTKFDQDKNLMEQKERVKTLVNDNLALKRENESLRKQLEACKLEGKVKEEKWMRGWQDENPNLRLKCRRCRKFLAKVEVVGYSRGSKADFKIEVVCWNCRATNVQYLGIIPDRRRKN